MGSEPLEHFRVQRVHNRVGEFDRVLEIRIGRDAVVAVDVSHRQADDNAGHPGVRKVDGRAVGGTAGAHRLLAGDVQLFRQVQRETLKAGVGNHPRVDMAQHRAFADGRLHGAGLHHGIVRRAAFKHDGHIRFYGVCGYSRAAGTHFFLHGQRAHHVHRQLFPGDGI